MESFFTMEFTNSGNNFSVSGSISWPRGADSLTFSLELINPKTVQNSENKV